MVAEPDIARGRGRIPCPTSASVRDRGRTHRARSRGVAGARLDPRHDVSARSGSRHRSPSDAHAPSAHTTRPEGGVIAVSLTVGVPLARRTRARLHSRSWIRCASAWVSRKRPNGSRTSACWYCSTHRGSKESTRSSPVPPNGRERSLRVARGYGVFAEEHDGPVFYAPVVRSEALTHLHRRDCSMHSTPSVRVWTVTTTPMPGFHTSHFAPGPSRPPWSVKWSRRWPRRRALTWSLRVDRISTARPRSRDVGVLPARNLIPKYVARDFRPFRCEPTPGSAHTESEHPERPCLLNHVTKLVSQYGACRSPPSGRWSCGLWWQATSMASSRCTKV